MTGIRYRFQKKEYRDRQNFKKYMEEGDYLLDMSAAHNSGDANTIDFFHQLLRKISVFLQQAILIHKKNHSSSRAEIPEKKFYGMIAKDFKLAQENSPRSTDSQETENEVYSDSDDEKEYLSLWAEHNNRSLLGKPFNVFVPHPFKAVDLRTASPLVVEEEEKPLTSAEARAKAIQQWPSVLSRKSP